MNNASNDFASSTVGHWPSQHYTTSSNQALLSGLVLTEKTSQESCASPKASTKNSMIRLTFPRMFCRTWRRVETVRKRRVTVLKGLRHFSLSSQLRIANRQSFDIWLYKNEIASVKLESGCWTDFTIGNLHFAKSIDDVSVKYSTLRICQTNGF